MTSPLARRHRPASKPTADTTPTGVPDASSAAIARNVQIHCPGWMIFWSPWRRMFTAIACFTRDPVLIDTPTLNELLDSMRAVETADERQRATPAWMPMIQSAQDRAGASWAHGRLADGPPGMG
ncbi:hypothetical protein NE236_31265 [Actinoallomurus purpureus]|uniref:hypothetical protein n=1 Tax=Actinoallomurus purpureus TaxID=478114 RepID=UPI002092A08A|nr:hypothetical protein [Actinoallomurus purpureus]MCO6009460.1 hypothetical protein [Actinoallomurus purpureus]